MNYRRDTAGVARFVGKAIGLLPNFITRGAIALVVFALGGLAQSVWAQANAEGYIYGTATGATSVTVVNSGTNLTRVVTVAKDGNYLVPALPIGSYTVTAKNGDAVVQTQENVSVSLGVGTAVRFGDGEVYKLSAFEVSAGKSSMIDTSQTGVALNMRKEVIDALPVQRDLSAVMLLAPGVTKGDSAFGDVPSFAGASVAENNYFVNGFNITDFRHGTDYTRVPFDFQQEFQVKVGGYGVQYGRSLGGITSVTTKSGSNKFVGGASVIWWPDAMRWTSPRTYQKDGSIYSAPDLSKSESKVYQAYFGGPLIKNHLFFYGLYSARDVTSESTSTYATTYYKDKSKDPFWGGKLDYQINDTQRLEFTAISDKRKTEETSLDYTFATGTIGAKRGVTDYERGGHTYIGRYSGTFGDNVQVSAMYGQGGMNLTNRGSGDSNPYIYDGRSGSLVPLGSWSQSTTEVADDKRKQYRLDAGITLGNHEIKVGADMEDNVSNDLTAYSGGVYWRYYAAPASGRTNGVANTSQYARKRVYRVGGSFRVKDTSLYVEDNFKMLDNKLLISAGLRDEGFKNYNKDDKLFIEAKNQLAPRIAASYDPTGRGDSKIFANFGLYYIPIAANTNIRASGGEYYTEEYFVLNSVNSDGTPTISSQLGSTIVNSDGIAPNPTTLVDLNIKPMYQTEYIVGFQKQINEKWSYTVRAMYRNLESVIDDTYVPLAIDNWAARTGKAAFTPDADYVLFNPGRDLTFMADTDGNGTLESVTLTKADLDMPSPVRKYLSFEVEVERTSKQWYLSASYTWSHNYGNFEGWVKSDNEQNDPGISAAFDGAEFMHNTYGNLPNDRRHVFKAFGYYRVTSDLTVGLNSTFSSGRPIAKMGQPPGWVGISGYANAYMLAQRGSLGTSPWVFELDSSIKYRLPFWNKRASVSASVTNLLNRHTPLKYNEFYEDANQTPNLYYGIIRTFQEPRSVRLTFSVDL